MSAPGIGLPAGGSRSHFRGLLRHQRAGQRHRTVSRDSRQRTREYALDSHAIVVLVFYTPLKRKTPLYILVGAFPGAIPPLVGWAAASGRLGLEAWVLYAILFLWQFPHFMAIAWMYREDYDRAGYCVLPHSEARDNVMCVQTLLPLLTLFPVALLPALGGQPNFLYCLGGCC